MYIYIYTYLSKTFGNVVQEFVEKIFSWGTNTVGKIPWIKRSTRNRWENAIGICAYDMYIYICIYIYVYICIYIYYYRHFKISSICLHDKKMPAFVRDIPLPGLPFRCTYSIIFDDTRVVVKNQDLCMGFCPALCLTGAATWMCTF